MPRKPLPPIVNRHDWNRPPGPRDFDFVPSIRLTFKYIPAYSYEDEHLNLGRDHMVKRTSFCSYYRNEEDCLDVSRIEISRFHLPLCMTRKAKRYSKQRYRDFLWNIFGDRFTAGCTCEHDCCGHWFGGVSKIRTNGPREVIVEASYSRNY